MRQGVGWLHEEPRGRGESLGLKGRARGSLLQGEPLRPRGGLGPAQPCLSRCFRPALPSPPLAHRTRCEWWMWTSQSWGRCPGALLGCLRFHAGLDTCEMSESISETCPSPRFSSFWILLVGAGDFSSASPGSPCGGKEERIAGSCLPDLYHSPGAWADLGEGRAHMARHLVHALGRGQPQAHHAPLSLHQDLGGAAGLRHSPPPPVAALVLCSPGSGPGC